MFNYPEVRIEFKLINALTNQPIESVPVEVTRDLQGPISVSTDAEGLAEFGPFVPGESITVKVSQEGFDDIEQVIIAYEDAELILLAANPTVSFLTRIFLSFLKLSSRLYSFFNNMLNE